MLLAFGSGDVLKDCTELAQKQGGLAGNPDNTREANTNIKTTTNYHVNRTIYASRRASSWSIIATLYVYNCISLYRSVIKTAVFGFLRLSPALL
jgi:hypothetical protein